MNTLIEIVDGRITYLSGGKPTKRKEEPKEVESEEDETENGRVMVTKVNEPTTMEKAFDEAGEKYGIHHFHPASGYSSRGGNESA